MIQTVLFPRDGTFLLIEKEGFKDFGDVFEKHDFMPGDSFRVAPSLNYVNFLTPASRTYDDVASHNHLDAGTFFFDEHVTVLGRESRGSDVVLFVMSTSPRKVRFIEVWL